MRVSLYNTENPSSSRVLNHNSTVSPNSIHTVPNPEQTSSCSSSTTTTEAQSNSTANTCDSETNVKMYLKDAGFDIDNLKPLFLKEVVSKYNLIKRITPNTSEDELKRRTVNFAKGLQFHEFGARNKTGEFEVQDPNKTGEVLVELYDQNGDNTVSIDELFYRKLIDEYSKKGGSYKEIRQKALSKVKEYSQYISDPSKASGEEKLSDEWNWFADCLSQLGLLDVVDQDGNQVQDNQLNKKELGVFVETQLNRNNAVSATTQRLSDRYIQAYGMDVDDIMNVYHLTEEKAQKFIENRDKFLENLKGFQDFRLKQ